MASLSVLLVFLVPLAATQFVPPEIILQAGYPAGFRAFIPDFPGCQRFAFHGKINNPFTHRNELGSIFQEVQRPQNGFWIVQDYRLILTAGDIVHFWTSVVKDGVAYPKYNQTWQVPDPENAVDILSPIKPQTSTPEKTMQTIPGRAEVTTPGTGTSPTKGEPSSSSPETTTVSSTTTPAESSPTSNAQSSPSVPSTTSNSEPTTSPATSVETSQTTTVSSTTTPTSTESSPTSSVQSSPSVPNTTSNSEPTTTSPPTSVETSQTTTVSSTTTTPTSSVQSSSDPSTTTSNSEPTTNSTESSVETSPSTLSTTPSSTTQTPYLTTSPTETTVPTTTTAPTTLAKKPPSEKRETPKPDPENTPPSDKTEELTTPFPPERAISSEFSDKPPQYPFGGLFPPPMKPLMPSSGPGLEICLNPWNFEERIGESRTQKLERQVAKLQCQLALFQRGYNQLSDTVESELTDMKKLIYGMVSRMANLESLLRSSPFG